MPTYIVNQTFFVRDIVLPNLDHTSELGRINYFIAKYEPECLCKIMGYPLYKVFGTENSQRMTDLLDGAEYVDGVGVTQKWQGLKHDTNISLIANYIYFYFQESNKQQTTGTGTSTNTPTAGVASSPADKMEKAWNFFSEEVYKMSAFLWLKKDGNGVRVYPEFTYHQFLETKRISRKINATFSF